MTRADLGLIGRYLYGPRWQSRLAQEIRVNPRTVRRWALGERRVPARRATQIAALARMRYMRRSIADRERFLAMAAQVEGPVTRATLVIASL